MRPNGIKASGSIEVQSIKEEIVSVCDQRFGEASQKRAQQITDLLKTASNPELATLVKKLITDNSYRSAEIVRDILYFMAGSDEARTARLLSVFPQLELNQIISNLKKQFVDACNTAQGLKNWAEDRREEIKTIWPNADAGPPASISPDSTRAINTALLYFESLHCTARHGSPYRRADDVEFNAVLKSIPRN